MAFSKKAFHSDLYIPLPLDLHPKILCHTSHSVRSCSTPSYPLATCNVEEIFTLSGMDVPFENVEENEGGASLMSNDFDDLHWLAYGLIIVLFGFLVSVVVVIVRDCRKSKTNDQDVRVCMNCFYVCFQKN